MVLSNFFQVSLKKFITQENSQSWKNNNSITRNNIELISNDTVQLTNYTKHPSNESFICDYKRKNDTHVTTRFSFEKHRWETLRRK